MTMGTYPLFVNLGFQPGVQDTWRHSGGHEGKDDKTRQLKHDRHLLTHLLLQLKYLGLFPFICLPKCQTFPPHFVCFSNREPAKWQKSVSFYIRAAKERCGGTPVNRPEPLEWTEPQRLPTLMCHFQMLNLGQRNLKTWQVFFSTSRFYLASPPGDEPAESVWKGRLKNLEGDWANRLYITSQRTNQI